MFQDDKRESIGRRTINGIIILTLLLTIAVSLPVTYGFSVLSKRHYYEDTSDYAGIVSHVINGDTPQFGDITMLAFRYNGK